MLRALTALLLTLATAVISWAQSVPVDHFPGLVLNPAIPAVWTTGAPVTLAGQLADTDLEVVVFSLAPQGGGEAVDFYVFDVRDGRFERTVALDHERAGAYDLEVYAGRRGQPLPGLGVYTGLEVTRGSGALHVPVDYFDGLRLDAPLPADLPVGVSVPFAGEVVDPTVRELRLDVESADGSVLRSLTVGLDSGRFSYPLRTLAGEAGPLRLTVVVGLADGTWWDRGSFPVRAVDEARPELEVHLLGLSLAPGGRDVIPLRNRGDAELTVTAVRVEAPFEVVSFPPALAAGEQGQIAVAYSGSGGDEALLVIDSDDPVRAATRVALSGLPASGDSGRRLEHRRADAAGVLRLDLDLDAGDYALALYSADLTADSGAVHAFGVGGPPPLTRPVPTARPLAGSHRAQDWADAQVRARERAIAAQVRRQGLPAARPAGSPAAADYQIGDRRSFVFDAFGSVPRQLVPSRVVAVNDRAVALVHESWYDGDPQAPSAARLQAIIDQFATDYDLAVTTFGSPSDVDGDGRIAFLFSPLVDAVGIAGFQDPNSVVAPAVGGNGNLTDLLFLSPTGSEDSFRSLLIHEFQHLINFNQHVLVRYGESESGWLNEGLSHLSEDLVEGFTDGGNAQLVQEYLARPEATGLAGPALLDRAKRGAAYLFVRGLVDRLGQGVLRRLVATGLADRDNVEAAAGEPFDELLATWATQVYASGTGLAGQNRFEYEYDLLRSDAGRGLPMPAALTWSPGTAPLAGRIRPRGANFAVISGRGRQTVEIHADPAAALGAVAMLQPAGFAAPVEIPAAYFPGLDLDRALPGELRTGEALTIAGQVAGAGVTQLALDFTPRDGGAPVGFFSEVAAGRVERALVFDHSQAGEYDLAVFAGVAGHELDYLGSFSPVRIRPGSGVVLVPATYFNGLRLDAPLPGSALLGTATPVAGQVLDAGATTVFFEIADSAGVAVADVYCDVAGGRFAGVLPTAGLAADTYSLAAYVGDRQLAYAGAYAHLHVVAELPTAVSAVAATPGRLALEQNYPNPFNQGTAIRFEVPGPGPQAARLELFNVLGQRLATLVDGPLAAGPQAVRWDGYLNEGRAAATGVYVYRLSAGGRTLTRRLALTR